MKTHKLISFNFLQSINNKEQFYDQIMEEKDTLRNTLNHFIILCIFSCLYGVAMGCHNGLYQALSSGVKLPILFALIILICFPAFFVIQAILGSKLTLGQMLSVILAGFMMTASIMVSFAPIVIFFLITGGNYGFIKLLHVAIITLSGLFGMVFVVEALRFSCEKKEIYPKIGVRVFKFWIVILAFVGTQLSWSLRPFIGSKELPFQLFRKQEGNFYQAIVHSVQDMIKSDKQ